MDINYEIIKDYGSLNGNDKFPFRVCLIRWNGADPKLDIRKWAGEKPLKGITLTSEEKDKLKELLLKAEF